MQSFYVFQFHHAIHEVKGQRLEIEKIEDFTKSDDIKKVSVLRMEKSCI